MFFASRALYTVKMTMSRTMCHMCHHASLRPAAELARPRYRQGFIGFFEVLAAEQELIDTRDALIESRTAETLAMVNIYRALAGAPGDAEPIASAND